MFDKIFRYLLTLAIIFSFAFPSQAITQWNANLPAATDLKSSWPAAVNSQWKIVQNLVSNYRRGLNVSYVSSSSLSVSAGEIAVNNGTAWLFLQNASPVTITSANLDSGVIASSSTYYVYCGTNSSTDSSCTYYISLNNTTPVGVTYYAQIGSFVTDSGSNFQSPINVNNQATLQNYNNSDTAYSTSNAIKFVTGETVGGLVSNLPFTSSTSYACVTSTGASVAYTSASSVTLGTNGNPTSLICVGS